jgi:hypothetical protein
MLVWLTVQSMSGTYHSRNQDFVMFLQQMSIDEYSPKKLYDRSYFSRNEHLVFKQ